jgi:hypothetical protein
MARWRQHRSEQVKAEPNCQRCKDRSLIVPATIDMSANPSIGKSGVVRKAPKTKVPTVHPA